MPDMNTALYAQERNNVSSHWYSQSMSDGRGLKVGLQFSKCDADYACCNVCDAKCKASGGNTSNLRKHLVKHKIFLKEVPYQFKCDRYPSLPTCFIFICMNL
ncbi:hypothetical protein XENOCAPTIV_015443 [Xenoophorus captivus]|uniref:BED-type domain-containing protein n=1 Tax=Xenoophorus captivus TaxID=1517983 RepID=A0ABV0RJY4_9TELE